MKRRENIKVAGHRMDHTSILSAQKLKDRSTDKIIRKLNPQQSPYLSRSKNEDALINHNHRLIFDTC